MIPFPKQHLLQAVNEYLQEDLSKKPGDERMMYKLSFIHCLIFVMHRPSFLTFKSPFPLTPELILSFSFSVRKKEGREGRESKHKRESEQKQKRESLGENKLCWILLPETFVKINRDGCNSNKIELFRHRFIKPGQDGISNSFVLLHFL